MDNFPSTTGKTPKMKEIQAIAFHDSKGIVRHMHHIIVLEGARPVDSERMKLEAITCARELGTDVSKLKALHVAKLADPRAMYRVDVKKRILVEIEPKKQVRTKRKKVG